MKNYRIVGTLSCILALATFTGAIAQNTKPEPCPEVTVIGPPTELRQDDVGDYYVIIDLHGIYREINFEWSAMGGKVLEGQGTDRAKIKRTSDSFFVNVEIRGLRPRCEQVYREVKPDLTPPEAIMLDRTVGPLTSDDEEKIKRFVDATKAERAHVFWVILAFNKNESLAVVSERRRFLLDSFHKNGRIGHDVRVTFVEVEADETFIEFWKTTSNVRPPLLEKYEHCVSEICR